MGKRNIKAIWSPFVIIGIGFSVSFIANSFIGAWAFIPLALIYWTAIFVIVKPNMEKVTKLFKYPPNHARYILLTFVPTLFCIISFAWGIQYINGSILIILWIVFAIVNSTAEEMFWRGYLLDNLHWNPAIKVLFSTVLFLISHLMWGVFSITIRSYIMILPLLIMGMIWGYAYHKTKSLKWCSRIKKVLIILL